MCILHPTEASFLLYEEVKSLMLLSRELNTLRATCPQWMRQQVSFRSGGSSLGAVEVPLHP